MSSEHSLAWKRSEGRGGSRLSAIVFLLISLATLTGHAQDRAPVPPVRDLAVEGNRRIEAGTILNRVKTKIGDPFNPIGLRDDVRTVFGLGFFDDVQLRVEEFEGGVRVIFVVVERPILREFIIEGNRELSTDDLRSVATIAVGGLYNPTEIQRIERAIREKYEEEGFFGVSIAPRTERSAEGDLRVVLRIQEGRKFYIDRIEIDGNEALSDRQIKGAMQTEERFLWILPFAKVQRRVFEQDRDRILNLYADNGFIQARVESHEILPDLERGKVLLRIRVVEGPQFRVGSLKVTGNTLFTTEQLGNALSLKEGDVYSRAQVRSTMTAVGNRYSSIGRSRAEVTPTTDIDLESRRVNVSISIQEGPEVYVERINIIGNASSNEKVLRRELRVVEGELFTFDKLVRSRQRLFNLGYFDEVNATVDNGSAPDRVVVNISVRERPTGIFSIGAGYSSLDGVFGTFDLTQRNLFGRGQEVFLRFRIGADSRLGLIGFTEPYLFDIPLRAGFDIYTRERDFNDFDESRIGGDLRASYPLTEFIRVSSLYRLETVEITNVADDASDELKREQGTRLNSVIEFGLSRDTRDNFFEPSRGSRHGVDVAFAGLGGDTRFYKIVGETVWFFPLPIFDWVLGARALAGYVHGWGGEEVPLFERFFLGGVTTLRGQEARSVAPVDQNGDVIGGTSEVLVSTELLIPIIPRLRLALFFDAGNAYGFGTAFDPTDLRYSAGAGIRFFSPFGPLRLEYAFNLDRKAGEDSGQFIFSVGGAF